MKQSSRKQRRRSRDYQDKRRQGQAKEERVSDSERLTRSEPAPTQGLRLPSAKGKLLLMEAKDGSLVSVPQDRLEDWMKAQNQGEGPEELTEREGMLLEKVLEMLYGKAM